jgi:peroxiredoxin Q/BCP
MRLTGIVRNLLLSLSLLSFAVNAEVNVGDAAPDFRLMGSDGNYHALSDYRGKKPVVIAFFPKAYTGGCTIECKALRDSDAEIQKFDVAYFMASVDMPEDNKGFAEQNEATFPILSDPEKTTCEEFGVLAERGYARRWTYYIDKEGIVQMIDREVNPKTAGVQLVKNLETLGF